MCMYHGFARSCRLALNECSTRKDINNVLYLYISILTWSSVVASNAMVVLAMFANS